MIWSNSIIRESLIPQTTQVLPNRSLIFFTVELLGLFLEIEK